MIEFTYEFTTWGWVALLTGAFLVGLTKTGVPGLGIVVVALFALVMPAKVSTGAILPLLLVGDVIAVSYFRRRADWKVVLRLIPPTVVGVVIGYWAMGRMDEETVKRVLGGIIVLLMVMQVCRDLGWLAGEKVPHTWWFAALFGIAAGFTTMMSNAAGPITIVYLLAVGLDKVWFMGTAAWFFLIINAFKVPFSCNLGLINVQSLLLNARLAVVVGVGALCGIVALRHIPQRAFKYTAMVVATLAGLKLLLGF